METAYIESDMTILSDTTKEQFNTTVFFDFLFI